MISLPSHQPTTPARDRLVLALDVGGLDPAVELARAVAPWFATVKIGMELYAEAGDRALETFADLGFRIFLDLKLHDIPNTVERAARVYGRRGVSFFTLHASGGVSMLEAGVQGLADGAADAGVEAPIALGVTVLTSETDTSPFAERLGWAAKAGCQGVVASGLELGQIRADYPDLGTMIPGVRLPDGDVGDQARVVTPGQVVAGGGDWLVIGRAVSGAADRAAAAAMVAAAVESVT